MYAFYCCCLFNESNVKFINITIKKKTQKSDKKKNGTNTRRQTCSWSMIYHHRNEHFFFFYSLFLLLSMWMNSFCQWMWKINKSTFFFIQFSWSIENDFMRWTNEWNSQQKTKTCGKFNWRFGRCLCIIQLKLKDKYKLLK